MSNHLGVPENITPLPLPPRSLELNPVENVWQFRDAVSRRVRAGRRRIVIVSPRAGWPRDWLDWAGRQREVKSGTVVPVFVATPAWLRSTRLAGVPGPGVPVFLPRPWGDQMLRAFLAEIDGSVLDHRSRRAALLEGSGGVPTRLTVSSTELAAACRAEDRDPDAALAEWTERQRLDPEEVGLSPELVPLVRELDTVDADSIEVLCDLLREAWPGPGEAPDAMVVLGLFADLGLLELRDPKREGVRLSALGRLVKRSLDAE